MARKHKYKPRRPRPAVPARNGSWLWQSVRGVVVWKVAGWLMDLAHQHMTSG